MTTWQVGGFGYQTLRRGHSLTVWIDNDLDLSSFFYHVYPAEWNWSRSGSGFGPFGNIHQHFHWDVPVPKVFWDDGKK